MKIKRVFFGLLLTIYVIVAVFLTACLLTYNDYKISEFGKTSFVIVKNEDFEPNYKKGSLLIIKKNDNSEIKVNDEIFFYNTYKNQVSVSHSKVVKVQKVTDTETTFVLAGDYPLSSQYVIGKADTTKVINNVGTYMSVLESRWGFLFIIVLPISVLFIYEIYVIVKEIARPDDDNDGKKEIKDEPSKEDNNENGKEVIREEIVSEVHEEMKENKEPAVEESESKEAMVTDETTDKEKTPNNEE